MGVSLLIRDGDPWYLSPDIWMVPGPDIDGPAAAKANVAEPTYLWARVRNDGDAAVQSATIKYYAADPSTVITRASATQVGTSYVSLAAGETKEVPCLTPWIPAWINDGHACLVAESFHATDPIVPYGPDVPFDPPNVRQVAQRNIGLVQSMSAMGMYMYAFSAGADARHGGERALLRVGAAPVGILKNILPTLGLKKLPVQADGFQNFGLQPFRVGDCPEDVGKEETAIPAGRQVGVVFAAKPDGPIAPGTAALFLVEQVQGERVIGGIGVLVVGGDETKLKREKY